MISHAYSAREHVPVFGFFCDVTLNNKCKSAQFKVRVRFLCWFPVFVSAVFREHPDELVKFTVLHLLLFCLKRCIALYGTTHSFVPLDINTVISSYWSVLGMTNRQVVLGLVSGIRRRFWFLLSFYCISKTSFKDYLLTRHPSIMSN